MKELDLTMVKIAQENSNLNKEELAEIQRNFYETSIQKPDKIMKQEVHGKKYPGEIGKKITKVVVGIAAVIVVGKATLVGAELVEYDRTLDQKIENELTLDEQKDFEQNHNNFFSNIIEASQNIREGKNSLEADDYDFFGNNISGIENKYSEFDEDSIINLTEFQQDAIDIATDNVIEEYKRGAK